MLVTLIGYIILATVPRLRRPPRLQPAATFHGFGLLGSLWRLPPRSVVHEPHSRSVAGLTLNLVYLIRPGRGRSRPGRIAALWQCSSTGSPKSRKGVSAQA